MSLLLRLKKLEAIIRKRQEAGEATKLTWEEGSLEYAFLQEHIDNSEISEEEAEQIRKECNETDNPLTALLGHPVLIKLDWEDWDQEDGGVLS